MSENERQQRMIERVQEDERLRGDLEGNAATALVTWATEKVREITADTNRPDADVDAEVQRLRITARQIARSGESDPQQLVALAEATWSGTAQQPEPQHQAITAPPQAAPTPTEHVLQSPFARVRHRWGERLRRWFRR